MMGDMADDALLDLRPDGTIYLTVGDTRHHLRQITLGELRRFRDLYTRISAEVTDNGEFDVAPQLKALRDKVETAKTKAARTKQRAELNKIAEERDRFIQTQWAGWWREVIGTLSETKLPEGDKDDPASDLPVWMVESPNGIPPLFSHWRAVPLGES